MSDHTYTQCDLVERISTGEIATFCQYDSSPKFLILHVSNDDEGVPASIYWPSDDCRPAVDHDMKKCPNCENCITNLRKDNAAKDAEIARLRKLCGEAAEASTCVNSCQQDECEFHSLNHKLRAAAEGV